MCETTDGFRIAEKDMELRGPGDIAGTRQSGLLDFKLADIVHDRDILQKAVQAAHDLLEKDPELDLPANTGLIRELKHEKGKTPWSRIS